MECPNCEAMDWPNLPDGNYTCSACHQTYYLRTSGVKTALPQITHHCPACEAAAQELANLRARIAALAAEWSANAEAAMLDGDNRAADETEWYAQKLRALLAEKGER